MTRLAIACALLASACATFRPADASLSIQPLLGTQGNCTTWSVAPGKWVTAKHCLTVGGREGWTIAGAPALVLAVSPDADLALLSGPSVRPISVASAEPPLGATILVFGYGMNRPDLLWFSGVVVAQASKFFDSSDEPQMLISGANGMPGMSGGPVTYRGRVVSQVSGGGLATSPTHLVGSGVSWGALSAFVRLNVTR